MLYSCLVPMAMLPRGEGWKLVSAVGLDCKFVPLPWLIIRYAPQLPDIFGNGSWLGRTGGYFQQLGGTMYPALYSASPSPAVINIASYYLL